MQTPIAPFPWVYVIHRILNSFVLKEKAEAKSGMETEDNTHNLLILVPKLEANNE